VILSSVQTEIKIVSRIEFLTYKTLFSIQNSYRISLELTVLLMIIIKMH